MSRRALVPTVLTLLLTLPACSADGEGGGGGGGDGPDPQEVKRTYVEQATTICERADAEFTALARPSTPDRIAPYVSQTVAIASRAQSELSALTPPEPDRAALQGKVLDPFTRLVEDGKAFAAKVSAAGADETKLLSLLGEAPSPAAIDEEFLRSYGLGVCADAIGRAG